jgi:hypothetical protein
MRVCPQDGRGGREEMKLKSAQRKEAGEVRRLYGAKTVP